MTESTIPYDRGRLLVRLPAPWTATSVTWLAPTAAPAAPDPLAEVSRALDAPLGDLDLTGFADVRSVAITINDKTRPVPHQHLLPPLLQRLEGMGLPPAAITLIIATGTHPVMPLEEYSRVLPADILARYPVICHDCDDQSRLVYLGQTSRGTPVWVNKHFYKADLRIVLGNIEPHQFQGFSGGVKSAAIGLAGKETVNANHSLMSAPEAALGRYDDNPTRQDVEEMGRMIGVHFALNVVINDHKQVVTAFAGEPAAVMQAGIAVARRIYQVAVAQPFDLMIVSPGGYPKDINLYQSQKGLAHAALVIQDGGMIILAAACPEGVGSKGYEAWMDGMTSHHEVLERFRREGFRLGAHKAFMISRDASRVRVLLVSTMSPATVSKMLLTPAPSLDAALAQGLAALPSDARIGIMPLANTTIPVLKKKGSGLQ